MKHSPYSFSKLNTFQSCNRKFKYQYLEKLPREKVDTKALGKGGAIHSILEEYPFSSTHPLAPKFQYIVDKFVKTYLGKKYLSNESIREFNFGLSKDLIPTDYNDKESLFRGSVDFICTIDNSTDEIIEVENLSDVPHGYEIVEKNK